ncbi:uncharacterized protein K489DRAFT_366263 [Dissoconium aciculare CBS 342.82]|uniref:Ubiquitin 3 binding protein But2 C-terminal domain-containing protein n=1 Tax=Dissoconium aciculare CBS 342.82 TaxID=1314786 RepID=A0A6J3MGI0_9PEZI|nr:uncharacterized protein K489DRAFT_366263 [Dissoconium aciculare CBS 342.82]KAF1827060.1 hypothetical protein K489DRAFT_366263 [Dissoconium aciculare CBS 342.82]
MMHVLSTAVWLVLQLPKISDCAPDSFQGWSEYSTPRGSTLYRFRFALNDIRLVPDPTTGCMVFLPRHAMGLEVPVGDQFEDCSVIPHEDACGFKLQPNLHLQLSIVPSYMGKGNVRRIDLKCRYHNGSKAWGRLIRGMLWRGSTLQPHCSEPLLAFTSRTSRAE